mmetsp:Transcript_61110/g.176105  ORF Transcript_61110/g.176105 Transcript_61110/m.176105 type:complete len:250 (-) Transcript_61110:8-757(-)
MVAPAADRQPWCAGVRLHRGTSAPVRSGGTTRRLGLHRKDLHQAPKRGGRLAEFCNEDGGRNPGRTERRVADVPRARFQIQHGLGGGPAGVHDLPAVRPQRRRRHLPRRVRRHVLHSYGRGGDAPEPAGLFLAPARRRRQRRRELRRVPAVVEHGDDAGQRGSTGDCRSPHSGDGGRAPRRRPADAFRPKAREADEVSSRAWLRSRRGAIAGWRRRRAPRTGPRRPMALEGRRPFFKPREAQPATPATR